MIRRLLPALALVVAAGCVSMPPVHPRAVQENTLCAQYTSNGDLTNAEVHCDLGLQFSPQYADLWVNKGLIKLRQGHNDEAKDCFIKALHYNNEQAQAYSDLGWIYLQEKSYGKAHDAFERALKVNPDMTEARYNLALTYIATDKKVEAQKELRTLVAIKPDLADPHYSLGVIALGEGARDEAITEFRRAVQLAPDYGEAWLGLGNAYTEAARYDEAKDAYTSCISAAERKGTEAIECKNNLPIVVRKAALLDPSLQQAKDESHTENTPAAMYQLALTYREKGLKNEEERTYKKCLGLDGRYAPCHWGLFQIFRDLQDTHNATIACRNYLKFASADDFPKEVETCEKYVNGGPSY